MKYFVYVSDAKVDMLFAQIPRKISERISAELKISLKVISVTLRPGTAPDTRYAKLAVLDAYLREHEPVGSVADPKLFVAETLPFRSAVVGSTAVWCGRFENTIVGLTGAKQHLTIGSSPPTGDLGSISFEAMRSVAADLATLANDTQTTFSEHVSSLAFVATALRGPVQTLEFLAVNQSVEPVVETAALAGVERMLFGSPLYVAMA
jgi:hypothetical protein